MKKVFNPPLKPLNWRWLLDGEADQAAAIEPILCPKCGSAEVYGYAYVCGKAFVNVNTAAVDEPPEEADCSLEDARDADDKQCTSCGYEWENEAADGDGESMYPIGFIRYD